MRKSQLPSSSYPRRIRPLLHTPTDASGFHLLSDHAHRQPSSVIFPLTRRMSPATLSLKFSRKEDETGNADILQKRYEGELNSLLHRKSVSQQPHPSRLYTFLDLMPHSSLHPDHTLQSTASVFPLRSESNESGFKQHTPGSSNTHRTTPRDATVTFSHDIAHSVTVPSSQTTQSPRHTVSAFSLLFPQHPSLSKYARQSSSQETLPPSITLSPLTLPSFLQASPPHFTVTPKTPSPSNPTTPFHATHFQHHSPHSLPAPSWMKSASQIFASQGAVQQSSEPGKEHFQNSGGTASKTSLGSPFKT